MAGTALAYYGYETSIYPVDLANGYIDRAQSAGSPEEIQKFAMEAKRLLPHSGNPVWSFPTPRTDFALIQDSLDGIVSRCNAIASLDRNSSAYNTGMSDMRNSLNSLQLDLNDIMPYMYVSSTNVVFACVWVGVILFMFAVGRRGRARYKEEYETR